MTSIPNRQDLIPTAEIEEHARLTAGLMEELGRVIVGQRAMLERLLIGLLADGHVLLEGVPGLAKTLAVRTLASTISAGFHRIQFTPDLLPADLIGTMIYNQRTGDFTVQQGPIFTNLLLADEINRAPAKVQSALLEAMQEKQVTIGGRTFPLPELFLVLATQNPIEHEGTYPLPEAQVDRFMFKLVVTYPERREEREVLDRMTRVTSRGSTGARPGADPSLAPAGPGSTRTTGSRSTSSISSRRRAGPRPRALAGLAPLIEFGASPRATIFLLRAAKAHAFLQGRAYVTPDDIKALGLDVLRHRVILTYRADAEGMERTRCCAAFSRRCRCHESGGGHARGAAPGDHHPPPCARHHGRGILSAFRGRGVEFAEVREYQPGDEIRTIDWNVTARLGSAYVKRYLEERELTVAVRRRPQRLDGSAACPGPRATWPPKCVPCWRWPPRATTTGSG